MNTEDRHSQFSDLIAQHHNQLYAYIFAVVRNREDARDLLQSVCLVLWRKFDQFQPGTSFLSWARQTARFVVTSFLRHKRKSLRCVNEELADAIAETVFEVPKDTLDGYLAALRQCRSKLNSTDGELLRLRYIDELGSREIADQLGRPQQGICNSLKRIRRWLFECIRKELARQDCGKEGEHP